MGLSEVSEASGIDSVRRTRSASSRRANGDEIVVSSDAAQPVKRPRGRPYRASLLSAATTSTASSPCHLNGVEPRHARATAISSTSASSAVTPQELSSDAEYSTPATSTFPTPLAAEVSASTEASRPLTSLEIRLPARRRDDDSDSERALRKSIYSMKANRKLTEIIDSDEEDDDFSDTGRYAKIARQVQDEEFARAGEATLRSSPRRRSSRAVTAISSPLPAPSVSKRTRASTTSFTQLARPAKKSRVISDSEDPTASDIDMDTEIAVAAALDSELSDPLELSEDEATCEATADAGDDVSDVFSDDEPLSAKKRGKLPAKPRALPAKGRVSVRRGRPPTAATGSKSTFARSRNPARKAVTRSDDAEVADEMVGITSDVSSVSAVMTSSDSSDPEQGVSQSRRIAANRRAYRSGNRGRLSITSDVSSVSAVMTSSDSSDPEQGVSQLQRIAANRRAYRSGNRGRLKKERDRLEYHHPEIVTMWEDLEKMPVLQAGMAPQPQSISRQLKPFQLEGLAWMKEMEKLEWKGGLLGDEMGLGKTIQAVSLIMSDYPAKQPSLVLVPPVALMQWQSEIKSYTDGTLKTFVFHGTNQKAKTITSKELKTYDVIMMSYNSLESMYRKQEKGFKRKNGIHKEKSVIHSIHFHRAILDEAHSIKTRTTMTAKACFALQTTYRWCLTGTPLQNRIGEFFSLVRFLNVRPFALYLCKQCPCSTPEWAMNDDSRCSHCNHAGMQHVSVFNQELLNPIQKFGNLGPGREAFRKLRLMTKRIMLRRLKKDHTDSMELPVKEVYVERQFFGEEENDFANSIMTNGQRKFDTYVAQGVLLNNYANIFGLIMQMRQVADHPDLILKKNADGGQNVLICSICDEPAEDTVRSRCKHDFCRACVFSYIGSTESPDCPRCHIPLSIDLEQPEIEQDEKLVKKNSIINRIKMENWTSSSKIELLVHELHKLRSDNASHKSIIFSQFTTMLQLIEWRLRRAGITTVMLDGSMTPAQRQASIEHFMDNVDVECFLVSLKAGGVALNLTEASRVFIVDPWWNPAAEWQSADRCHRIGQTRPCTITRLCIEDSVESRMVLIQEKKTNMIHSTVNADDKAMESLSPEDMQFLFRGT
ncbi:DNA repair protein RAD16 [Metarhizium album ARSEF 1941]|uniref:DNA repair protein RAD16 n=1 Tax=Metarhizium album (strain ARSEF 1941) TaxID=1081103 RepID=A0A0B2WQ46_METAS|nr:DNA repair protein RAD16 [Metarhizium album ARSEF 1941]KHN95617.1 DNA repair protein RAD16 [Metarhizium album ARSEF 1941]